MPFGTIYISKTLSAAIAGRSAAGTTTALAFKDHGAVDFETETAEVYLDRLGFFQQFFVYNEFKAIEVAEVVESVATGNPVWPTFADGHEIMKVVDACFRASRERRWVKV